MALKYLDDVTLKYFWGRLKTYFVKAVDGKGLSTNDLTNELKTAYDNAVTTVNGIVASGGFDPLSVYPVGSIYLSVNSTNPAELFGGTWKSIGAGRVLQGADSTHAAGSTIEAGIPNIKGKFSLYFINNNFSPTAEMVPGFCMANETMSELPGGFPIDASNFSPVYGRSDTVQPPAFVVNIWVRTA